MLGVWCLAPHLTCSTWLLFSHFFRVGMCMLPTIVCACVHREGGLRMKLGVFHHCSFNFFIKARALNQTQSSLIYQASLASKLSLVSLLLLSKARITGEPPRTPSVYVAFLGSELWSSHSCGKCFNCGAIAPAHNGLVQSLQPHVSGS